MVASSLVVVDSDSSYSSCTSDTSKDIKGPDVIKAVICSFVASPKFEI